MSTVVVEQIDPCCGRFRRSQPLCDKFGYSRGEPIDRYYIEAFLAAHRRDIRGRVLEIGDATYTRRFGGQQVSRSDVLQHPAAGGSAAFVGDLASGAGLPDAAFDCAILTQTLECIYDCRAALLHIFRALRPGGVLLLTSGCLGHISRYDMQRWGDYWRFTPAAMHSLLSDLPDLAEARLTAYGNALTASAFLYGLAQHELPPDELERHEPAFPIVLTVRATKAAPGVLRHAAPIITHARPHAQPQNATNCDDSIAQLYTRHFLARNSNAGNACDCLVCADALAGVPEPRETLMALRQRLRPGGTLLATLPGLHPVRANRDYWRFTDLSARRLFSEAFPADNVTVETFGNVLTAAALLLGRGVAEFSTEELFHHDPDYQVLIGVRAVAPGGKA